MLHLDILTKEDIGIALHAFYDENGNTADIWVFDLFADGEEFVGHLTMEMFNIIMEEDLGTNRNSIFAAVTTCDSHADT